MVQQTFLNVNCHAWDEVRQGPRKNSSANTAKDVSLNHTTYLFMSELTLMSDHIPVTFVTRHLEGKITYETIGKLIQGNLFYLLCTLYFPVCPVAITFCCCCLMLHHHHQLKVVVLLLLLVRPAFVLSKGRRKRERIERKREGEGESSVTTLCMVDHELRDFHPLHTTSREGHKFHCEN